MCAEVVDPKRDAGMPGDVVSQIQTFRVPHQRVGHASKVSNGPNSLRHIGSDRVVRLTGAEAKVGGAVGSFTPPRTLVFKLHLATS